MTNSSLKHQGEAEGRRKFRGRIWSVETGIGEIAPRDRLSPWHFRNS